MLMINVAHLSSLTAVSSGFLNRPLTHNALTTVVSQNLSEHRSLRFFHLLVNKPVGV